MIAGIVTWVGLRVEEARDEASQYMDRVAHRVDPRDLMPDGLGDGIEPEPWLGWHLLPHLVVERPARPVADERRQRPGVDKPRVAGSNRLQSQASPQKGPIKRRMTYVAALLVNLRLGWRGSTRGRSRRRPAGGSRGRQLSFLCTLLYKTI